MVSRTVVTCIFLILFKQIAGTNLFQGDIQVLDNRAIVNFPETIDFVISLEGESLIDNVTLIYGTNATSCNLGGSRQPQDFDSDRIIELEWQWDLRRSGALPPGVEIWWQWEIEDENGHILTTDRQSTTVADDRYPWQKISNSNVTVNWYEGNSTFGQFLLTLASKSLERLNSEAGIATSKHIHLWIYPTAADVRDAVINSADWTGGVAFPNYGITVIGLRPGEDEWANDVIPHELAHLIVGTVIFNCRGGRLPTWLSEGLAEYSSGVSSESDSARLEEHLAEESLPPLHSLARGFSAYSGGANLAYTQSAHAVRYLIEVYGPEKITELLEHVKSGQTIDDALEATYGFDTVGLDVEWRLLQGYAPTPTSAADSALLEATPTLIPTLALAGIPVADTPTPPPSTPKIATPTASPKATATVLLTSPTDTRLPIEEVAVNSTATMPSPAVSASSSSAETSNYPLVLALAGFGLLILIGMVLLIRNRGG